MCIKERERDIEREIPLVYTIICINIIEQQNIKKQLISSRTQITDQLGVLLYTEKKKSSLLAPAADCSMFYNIIILCKYIHERQ